ncbi:MAG: hypothetical protein ACXAC5_00315 [Promethearchaeota archaeon]|jgi:hypothetical protein
MDHEIVQKLEEIQVLLRSLVEKTDETNRLLKDGIQTRWGHSLSLLEMDSDRFKKNKGRVGEGKEQLL